MIQVTRTCSVEGCGKPHYAKGFCRNCWTQWRRTGGTDRKERVRRIAKCSIGDCDYVGIVKRGWCPLHYGRWHQYGDPLHERLTSEERFWPKVNKSGPVPEHRPELGPCWVWLRKTNHGYGVFSVNGKSVQAYRFAYELAASPIPEGLTLDHLCHHPKHCNLGDGCPHRRCVNPAHLEAVPIRENLLRGDTFQARNAAKTHCDRGHKYTPETTRFYRGQRRCKVCEKEDAAKRRAAKTPEIRAKEARYARERRSRKTGQIRIF